jgi:hypothetical protein
MLLTLVHLLVHSTLIRFVYTFHAHTTTTSYTLTFGSNQQNKIFTFTLVHIHSYWTDKNFSLTYTFLRIHIHTSTHSHTLTLWLNQQSFLCLYNYTVWTSFYFVGNTVSFDVTYSGSSVSTQHIDKICIHIPRAHDYNIHSHIRIEPTKQNFHVHSYWTDKNFSPTYTFTQVHIHTHSHSRRINENSLHFTTLINENSSHSDWIESTHSSAPHITQQAPKITHSCTKVSLRGDMNCIYHYYNWLALKAYLHVVYHSNHDIKLFFTQHKWYHTNTYRPYCYYCF